MTQSFLVCPESPTVDYPIHISGILTVKRERDHDFTVILSVNFKITVVITPPHLVNWRGGKSRTLYGECHNQILVNNNSGTSGCKAYACIR